jgi:hypothetical protein
VGSLLTPPKDDKRLKNLEDRLGTLETSIFQELKEMRKEAAAERIRVEVMMKAERIRMEVMMAAEKKERKEEAAAEKKERKEDEAAERIRMEAMMAAEKKERKEEAAATEQKRLSERKKDEDRAVRVEYASVFAAMSSVVSAFAAVVANQKKTST